MDLRTKSTILIVALVALGLTGCTKQDSVSVAHNELGKFYNWSTVDWAGIESMYFRPYNCDWPEEIGAQIAPDFPFEYTSKY